jgi:hypothetical protein
MGIIRILSKKLENHFKSLNTNKIKTLFFHDVKILFLKME